MAVVNLTATRRGPKAASGKGEGANVKALKGAVIVGAADSANSTYDFGDIPADARILGISRLYYDDLASSGSPTIALGLFAVDSNITDDDDALNDSIDVYTAAGSAPFVKAIENYGKKAWEYVAGQTTNPGGSLKVKATLKTAAVNVGGDMAYELFYTID